MQRHEASPALQFQDPSYARDDKPIELVFPTLSHRLWRMMVKPASGHSSLTIAMAFRLMFHAFRM